MQQDEHLSRRLTTLRAISNSKTSSMKVRQALVAFASASNRVRASYLSTFNQFLETKHHEVGNTSTSHATDKNSTTDPANVPVEYPSDVYHRLYSTLRNHSLCTCSLQNSEDSQSLKHFAGLRLVDNIRISDNNVVFDAVFSTTLVMPSGDSVCWQQLRILTPR